MRCRKGKTERGAIPLAARARNNALRFSPPFSSAFSLSGTARTPPPSGAQPRGVEDSCRVCLRGRRAGRGARLVLTAVLGWGGCDVRGGLAPFAPAPLRSRDGGGARGTACRWEGAWPCQGGGVGKGQSPPPRNRHLTLSEGRGCIT